MSTAVALNISFEEMAKLTGQFVGAASNMIPRLSINRDAETEDGHSLPVGTFKIDSNDMPTVYAKTIEFRPYMNCFQYQHYDAINNKYLNKTVLFKQWSDEAIDELGGIRCGKIPTKKLEGMVVTDEQKALQDAVKLHRNLYGTVTATGVTADGTEVKVDSKPILWRSAGSAFQPVGDALNIITKAQRPWFGHAFDISLKREKQGSNVYYVPVLKTDLTKSLSITNDEFDLLTKFQETVDFENKQVISKFKKSKEYSVQTDEAVETGKMLDLSPEFNDDPF